MTNSLDNSKSLLYRAFLSFQAEQYKEAIALCEELLRIQPNSIGAIALEVLSLSCLDRPEAANAFISRFDEEVLKKVMLMFEQISPMPPSKVDIDAFLDLIDPHRTRH